MPTQHGSITQCVRTWIHHSVCGGYSSFHFLYDIKARQPAYYENFLLPIATASLLQPSLTPPPHTHLFIL